MSRPIGRHALFAQLGSIVQLAFIPRDFDAALRHWVHTMGVGPFFVFRHMQLTNTRYKGQPSDIDMTAAVGYWGDVQIELIQQHNSSPSCYNDWLSEGGTGFQHYGVVVDDFAAAHARLTAMGGPPVQETEVPGLVKVAYFKLPDEPQLVEILGSTPTYRNVIQYMRNAAAGWDGGEPIRTLPPDTDWSGGAK
jgi:methylmalonyl-CoA/ethylmalonyl-CoA epimerase